MEVVALILVAGVVVVALLQAAPDPTPPQAPAAIGAISPTSTPQPSVNGDGDGDGDGQAYLDAYLDALRAADIPTSTNGRAESEAAAAICEQLSHGVDQADLVRAVPAMLNGVDDSQASLVVELAEQHYCH